LELWALAYPCPCRIFPSLLFQAAPVHSSSSEKSRRRYPPRAGCEPLVDWACSDHTPVRGWNRRGSNEGRELEFQREGASEGRQPGSTTILDKQGFPSNAPGPKARDPEPPKELEHYTNSLRSLPAPLELLNSFVNPLSVHSLFCHSCTTSLALLHLSLLLSI
jgi:hypothetical protein